MSTTTLTIWAGRVTINTFPDEVLLHIFYFDRPPFLDTLNVVNRPRPSWRWHRLAQVCQKWRSVIFGSPVFLDLRLVCSPRTRVEFTGIWPPLPIIIRNIVNWPMPEDYDFNAVIAHHNRVCEINLFHLSSSQLQRLTSSMQEQFPELIHLMLDFDDCSSHPAPALPDDFLGQSAPRLQSFELRSIPFRALPKLLLSSTDLVRLTLWNIPHSGYISPESMATCLSSLIALERLSLGFRSPQSCPGRDRRCPPLPSRSVLHALASLKFKGASNYLEDLVARIDAPLLDTILITFFNQLIFDIPHFSQFMRRTPRFEVLNGAHVVFDDYGVRVESFPPSRTFDKRSGLRISCRVLDWQLSSLAQVCTSSFPSIRMVEYLYIYGPRNLPSQWQDDIENKQWLEIFHPFTGVKHLYVCKEFAQCITLSLQELVREGKTEVLPALENLLLEELQPSGPVQEAIEQFIAARQRVTVSLWERN